MLLRLSFLCLLASPAWGLECAVRRDSKHQRCPRPLLAHLPAVFRGHYLDTLQAKREAAQEKEDDTQGNKKKKKKSKK